MKMFEGTWHIQDFSNSTLRNMDGPKAGHRHMHLHNPFSNLSQSECGRADGGIHTCAHSHTHVSQTSAL